MTCEVAAMNKRGIALAADSAVTLGNGKKIYHTAEKLFSLSPSIPVAIMTFGTADMMNALLGDRRKNLCAKAGQPQVRYARPVRQGFLELHRGCHLAVSSRGSEDFSAQSSIGRVSD